MTDTKFPATHTVHWPSGPVDACAEHAAQLIGLAKFTGAHVVATEAGEGAECGNCVNEATQIEAAGS